MYGTLMGPSKKKETRIFFFSWELKKKQPEKIGYQHKTQCEKKRGM